MGSDAPEHPAGLSPRAALGSWLEGPGSVTGARDGFPGRRLGLPPSGPGSMASFGRRLLAFAVDAAMVAAIARGLLDNADWVTPLFAFEVWLLTAFGGGSAGQRITGLRVVPLDGRPVGPVRAFIRTVLLCLLIPALIWDADGRGLHDKVAGTVLVRAGGAASPAHNS